MKITKRHYDAALALANEAREALGKKPVKRLRKGDVGEPTSCAIANTIGSEVLVFPNNADMSAYDGKHPITVVYGSWDDWNGESEGVIAEGGRLAQRFALAFDEGEIPELIAS